MNRGVSTLTCWFGRHQALVQDRHAWRCRGFQKGIDRGAQAEYFVTAAAHRVRSLAKPREFNFEVRHPEGVKKPSAVASAAAPQRARSLGFALSGQPLEFLDGSRLGRHWFLGKCERILRGLCCLGVVVRCVQRTCLEL